MRPSTLLLLSTAVTVAAMVPGSLAAQQRDSNRVHGVVINIVPSRTAVITQPTVVVVAPFFAPDTLSVATTGCAVASEAQIACDTTNPGGGLADRRYGILTGVGKDIRVGYLIAAPGLRPMLVRGAVPRTELTDSVRAFLAVYDRQFRQGRP